MVEILPKFINGHTKTVLFTPHVNNTLHTTCKDICVSQLMFAVTAFGHHLQRVMMVSQDVLLSLPTSDTISLTIIMCKVQIK